MLARLTYRRGSTSSLGVGVNIERGGWKFGGSVERAKSGGIGIQWGTRGGQDEFHYTLYNWRLKSCGWVSLGSGGSHGGYWRSQRYEPTGHVGGNPSGRPRWWPVPRRENCVPYYPGGAGPELVIDQTTATKYDGGIQTPYITLAAQSGFSRATAVYADVRHPRLLCGLSGIPDGSRPGLLIVGMP